MPEAMQLDDSIDETRVGAYALRTVARKRDGGEGDMDEVLKRLGAVESSVSELRVQVGGIAATLPYLATKDDLNELRAQVSGIAAQIPYLATKEDMKADVLMLRADLYAMETKIIKWMIATVLTAVGLAFTIAKFVH